MTKNKLLLVEDSPADIDLVREVLSEFEHNIGLHAVTNGKEALDFLHRQGDYEDAPSPDLVLLDLDLPKMNGFEFLREIRSKKRFQQLPVIVLTMSNAEEDISRAYKNDANCCITKPLGFEDFNQVMQSINNFWFELAQLPPALPDQDNEE